MKKTVHSITIIRTTAKVLLFVLQQQGANIEANWAQIRVSQLIVDEKGVLS